MRRVRMLYILTILLLCGGVVSFVPASADAIAMGGQTSGLWLGGVLFLLALCCSLLIGMALRLDSRKLASRVRAVVHGYQPGPIEPPNNELRWLTVELNELLDTTGQNVRDNAVRVRQLELELKVAHAEREHAEAIIYSISDGVLVTSAFDELILANDAAAKALEFRLPESSDRQPVDQVLTDKRMVELIRDMRKSHIRNGRRIVELAVPTPEGAKTYKVTLSSVSGGPGNDAAGVVAVLHDMTREKEVAEMKNQFVSNVSHELRTPLASIKAYVELLIDGEAEDKKTEGEFYEIIQNEANRLGRLIDNILSISRIESGLIKVNKAPTSGSVVAREAVECIASQARLKRITIIEDLAPVFYQVNADRDMLYQAVLNLLSNAVKYTPEGGSVKVVTRADAERRCLLVCVSDTGVGIPEKDLPLVFDKFFRAEANNCVAKGTGLGLSLVKHIIETVHQGRITARSKVGEGSTFGFELDLVE